MVRIECNPCPVTNARLDCTMDIDAIPCFGYSIYRHGEYIHVPYPSIPDGANDDNGAPKKKAMGMSFHHGRFIQKLRHAAKNTSK